MLSKNFKYIKKQSKGEQHMKTMKRFLATMVAVLLMTTMLVVPASADGYSISISGALGHTFKAYKIFGGTISETILSDVVWGDGVNPAKLVKELKEDSTIGTRFASITFANPESPTSEELASAAISVVTALTASDWAEDPHTIAFSKVVANCIQDDGIASSDNGDGTCTIDDLDAGYYLVIDTTGHSGDPSDEVPTDSANSRYMIQLSNNTTVSIKNGIPTLTKQVSLNPTTDFGKAVSAGPSNEVYFRLTAKMHNRVEDDYSTFPLIFTDTLPESMTFKQVEAIYVNETCIADADNSTSIPAISDTIFELDATDASIPIFTIKDAKSLIKLYTQNAGVVATDYVSVVYSATVSHNQLVLGKGLNGFGNQNSAVLTYRADPNVSTITSETIPATASVYSYQVVLTKQNAAKESEKLSGATFTLSFEDNNGNTKYVKAVPTGTPGEYNVVGVSTSLTLTDEEIDQGQVVAFTSSNDNANKGTIVIKGLREREYHLMETTAPEGFNKINTPQEIEIDADFDQNNGSLTTLTPSRTGTFTSIDSTKTNLDTGTVGFIVTNNKGATLPQTGGMGTTLFYIAGAVMMIGAGAVLVTKKRSQK